ncbi:MAG: thiolase family protein [Gammaproteobacteria bacterium]|nr:thiolase family protein [Gammaproteobacteria bacterium]
MSNSSPAAYIGAVSELRPGRYPEWDGTDMYRQVVCKFLAEHPEIRPADIQGLLVCPAGMATGDADIFVHERFGEEIGIQPRFAETINAGGATYGVMVQRAVLAVERGLADAVLCLGAGKFPKVGGPGAAEKNAKMASHPEFEFPYGTFIPALYAQAASRHCHEFGTTEAQLAAVSVNSRSWAQKHPDALMAAKGPLTVEQVLASKPIATPFKLLDCSVPCEGGAAVLVCNSDMACRLTSTPARILGMGETHLHSSISQAGDLFELGGKSAAKSAFAMAGVSPTEVSVLESYDSFSFNPILSLEGLGFVKPGGGGRFFEEGRAAPGGSLPVNTYGGLLSFGHTGDSSGMSMIVEATRQVMGVAGDRQVPNAEIALAHTYGGMMAEHSVLLLGRG